MRCGPKARACRCGCVTCAHIRLSGLVTIELCARPRENGQDLLRGKKVIVLPASKTVVFVFVLHVMHVVRYAYAMRTTSPSRAAYNEALGMTVNQLLFEHRMTRKHLADQFGVTRSVISRKLRGQVSWTAEELSIMAVLFDRKVDEFAPIRNGEEWVPAEWRPAMKKAPVPGGAEAGVVPPVGLEPTTFGLKVRR